MRVTATVLLTLTLALTVPAQGQEPEHLGPAPTRDQFPINLETLTYVPAPPDVLPAGAFEANLQCVEANTFEFSDIVKQDLQQENPSSRLSITLAQAQQFAAQNPKVPLIFFLQMETTLTTLRLRAGLGDSREAWIMVPVLRWSGGFEDGLIDWTHKTFGFNQTGRTNIETNQVRVVVIQYGKVTEYSDHSGGSRLQDPVLGLTQSLYDRGALAVAASFQVKPSVVSSLYDSRSGWDTGLQFTSRWTPNASMDTYFGIGGVHRRSGNLTFNEYGFRDQLGAHAMIEGWRTSAWRPFFQLVYLTGATRSSPGQNLGKSSLQHDLGVHWVGKPNLVFTLRYMNNITNNENTADMALIADVTWRFN
jgi:hypothetical protein